MGREASYRISLEYTALPSREQRRDRDGVLCCGKSGVVIGRDPESHLHIDLQHVSWLHAEISCLGSSFFLKDCGSANGTLINQQRIDSHRKYQLLDGDRIFVDDQPIDVSIPAWTDLLPVEEEATEEFAYSVSTTSEQKPELPEEETKRPVTTADHSEPKPRADEIVLQKRVDEEPEGSFDDDNSLILSFLAGIDLNPEDLELRSDAYSTFLYDMGQALFHAVDGVRKALYTHDSFRNQFRIPGTMWSRSQLNPLYNTEIDTGEVMKILLTSRSTAIAGPVGAIREATGDFYLHGIAVPTAVDKAIRNILDTFNWRALEKDFESSPGFTGFGPLKKARFWELYCKESDRQIKTLDEFDNSFRRVVAEAYSRAREHGVVSDTAMENPNAE